MSMHKIPLSDLERMGLEKHHLPIGHPSQLSDCFRLGVKWAIDHHEDIGVHAAHCFQDEYEDSCKYGDSDCPMQKSVL